MAVEEVKQNGFAANNGGSSAAGHWVYVHSDEHGWVPARVVRMDEEQLEAVVEVDRCQEEQEMLSSGDGKEADTYTVDLRDYNGNVLPLQNTDDHGKLKEYEDMVDLLYLHEAAILYNLKLRHIQEKPYTRTGDVVVAMNPYQWYHHLYQPDQQYYYANKLLWNEFLSADKVLDKEAPPQRKAPANTDVPPHVYETSTLAYKGMALWGRAQSILVSGESGAGKTETVKICMHHIAELQHGPNGMPADSKTTQVVERVLDSNPLLEAFGNAQTLRNDNSSRFGKYTQLQFDRQIMKDDSPSPAKLVGSTCEVYLLEKNRVVHHSSTDERTFHIFYELLSAPVQEQVKIWERLKGTTMNSFKYVGIPSTKTIEGVSDHDRFFQTVKALEVVGISGTVLRDLFRSLCIVLQLGNLVFAPDPSDDDKSIIASEDELKQLVALMGESDDTLRLALTERTMTTNNEVYKVPLTAAVAKESCDALAKDIYEKVFLWLVRNINLATCAENNYEKHNPENHGSDSYGLIGLLDIFGFEAYKINRFEQLCINYANEKLQYKFTEDCFRLVEAEYKEEGISLDNIMYDDNTDVLDLIEGKTGLLAMLNEECWRPQGNAAAFVNKALHQNKDSPCLIVNTMDRISFGVHHYAGKVLYDADNFVRMNQDGLASDLKECAAKTTNSIIAGEYTAAMEEAKADLSAVAGRSANSNLMAKTVWTKYKSQLSQLMTSLQATESRYVRCIKPNEFKAPHLLDHRLTINQLRSCGIVASVTISRSAFPNRMLNKSVVARFGGIWSQRNKRGKTPKSASSSVEKLRAEAEALLSFALKSRKFRDPFSGMSRDSFVVGKTKTFFRAGALEYLEAQRLKGLDRQAVVIQRAYRSFLKVKSSVLAARALHRRIEAHKRMAKERRERKMAEEEAKKKAAAKANEEFELRMKAEWEDFQARMAEEDKKFLEDLEREDFVRQAQMEADKLEWEAKMEREEREWKAKMEKEAKANSALANELAGYEAELAALKKRLENVDRDAAEKVKALDERCQQAKREKRDLDLKIEYGNKTEQEVRRETLFCNALLEERGKFIEQLKREQQRLQKIFERTEKKHSEIKECNKLLTDRMLETSEVFESSRRQSMTLNVRLDEKESTYKEAKAENQELHALLVKQEEAFTLMAEAKLELQSTMTKILEIVQSECKDQGLRDEVVRLNLRTSKDAYKQMKLVQKLQEEAMKNFHEYSMSDFNQSWMVH